MSGFPDLLGGVDRRSRGAVSVLLSTFPIIVLHRLLAGSRDVGDIDDEALVDRKQVLALDDELGHRGFSHLMPAKQ
jgi:hypothetical protein